MPNNLFQLGQGYLGFADAAVIVVVELIEGVLDNALFPSFIQIGTVIIKRVKVLSYTRHERLEARIRFGASSVKKSKQQELNGLAPVLHTSRRTFER